MIQREDLKIGMVVIEISDSKKETITDRTNNSICVTRTKRTDEGINCTNWFTIKDFEKEFKI